METIIIEFEKVTKYPLIQFLQKYRDFMTDSYPAINSYFSGKTESIDNKHLILLSQLTSECKDVMAQFKNFSNKFSNCGYWELMEYICNLNDTIEKINKLPKFRRTSIGKRGYIPSIQVASSIGSMRTAEDVANSVKQSNKNNIDWIELILNNDLKEEDWEIDELKPINVFINNERDVVVTTILDIPIGKRIYGKDISKKITLKNNDLLIVEYQDNIEQKCDILLSLNRGDVPENMLFGKKNILGNSIKQFSFPELVNDISNNFLQNDLFEYAVVNSYSFQNGDLIMNVEIKTKYDYKTEKKIVI